MEGKKPVCFNRAWSLRRDAIFHGIQARPAKPGRLMQTCYSNRFLSVLFRNPRFFTVVWGLDAFSPIVSIYIIELNDASVWRVFLVSLYVVLAVETAGNLITTAS